VPSHLFEFYTRNTAQKNTSRREHRIIGSARGHVVEPVVKRQMSRSDILDDLRPEVIQDFVPMALQSLRIALTKDGFTCDDGSFHSDKATGFASIQTF